MALDGGAIAGIVIGSIIVGVCLGCCCVYGFVTDCFRNEFRVFNP